MASFAVVSSAVAMLIFPFRSLARTEHPAHSPLSDQIRRRSVRLRVDDNTLQRLCRPSIRSLDDVLHAVDGAIAVGSVVVPQVIT